MIYKCNNCGCIFDEPIEIRTTHEAYNGVLGLFPNSHILMYSACPNCHDDDFEEIEDEDE